MKERYWSVSAGPVRRSRWEAVRSALRLGEGERAVPLTSVSVLRAEQLRGAHPGGKGFDGCGVMISAQLDWQAWFLT